MQVTKSKLKKIIEEELENMVREAGCPPGMTSQGNQCVGKPAAYKKPDVFRVASQGKGKGGHGGYSGTDVAPTQDADEFELNRARDATARKRASAKRKAHPAKAFRPKGGENTSKAIDRFGQALAHMGSQKV